MFLTPETAPATHKPAMNLRTARKPILAAAALLAVSPFARAAQHVTLRSGAEFDCTRTSQIPTPAGDRVRLYLIPTASAPATSESYIEVEASAILRTDSIPDAALPAAPAASLSPLSSRSAAEGSASPSFTPAAMDDLLSSAGARHNIDADLLASIVHAESAGNPRAVSRAGAQGLMQLMPQTAAELNVHNTFAPDQNISGGSAYLDQLLTRYDPNNDTRGLELAVAAYNAGPAAVERYHGIPPYAETRAYVARVVREFNRRKRAALLANGREQRASAR